MSADSVLKFALSKAITCGTLVVRTASGARLTFGDGTGPRVECRIHDRSAQFALLRDPDMQLGELFMNQRLTMERGTIYDFLFLALSNQKLNAPLAFVQLLDRFRFASRRLRQRNFGARSIRNVAHHYDLKRELYELFLDGDMQYSARISKIPSRHSTTHNAPKNVISLQNSALSLAKASWILAAAGVVWRPISQA